MLNWISTSYPSLFRVTFSDAGPLEPFALVCLVIRGGHFAARGAGPPLILPPLAIGLVIGLSAWAANALASLLLPQIAVVGLLAL